MLLTPNLQAGGLATSDASGDMSASPQATTAPDGSGFAELLGQPTAGNTAAGGNELPQAGIELPPAVEPENPEAIVASLNHQLDALLANDLAPVGSDGVTTARLPVADLPIVEAVPRPVPPSTVLAAVPDGELPVKQVAVTAVPGGELQAKQNTVTAPPPGTPGLRMAGQPLPVEPPATDASRGVALQSQSGFGAGREPAASVLRRQPAEDTLPGVQVEARDAGNNRDRNTRAAPDSALLPGADARSSAVKTDPGMVTTAGADLPLARQDFTQLAQNPGGPASGSLQGTEVSASIGAQLARPAEAVLTGARPPAVMSIDLPVQENGWDKVVSERVVVLANSRLQNAEIRLTPAELGPLRVTVSVEDGATHVNFQAAHALTRDAIEQALPRLRELLDASGLSLGDTQVGDQDVHERREQSSQSDSAATGDLADDEDTVATEQRAGRAERGLVDRFV